MVENEDYRMSLPDIEMRVRAIQDYVQNAGPSTYSEIGQALGKSNSWVSRFVREGVELGVLLSDESRPVTVSAVDNGDESIEADLFTIEGVTIGKWAYYSLQAFQRIFGDAAMGFTLERILRSYSVDYLKSTGVDIMRVGAALRLADSAIESMQRDGGKREEI